MRLREYISYVEEKYNTVIYEEGDDLAVSSQMCIRDSSNNILNVAIPFQEIQQFVFTAVYVESDVYKRQPMCRWS